MLRKGKKVATLRMGIKNYKKGEKVKIIAGGEEIGIAKIIDVRHLQWNKIRRKDVLMEGLRRKKDLKKELKEIYGKFGKNRVFTQIIFQLIGDEDGGGKV